MINGKEPYFAQALDQNGMQYPGREVKGITIKQKFMMDWVMANSPRFSDISLCICYGEEAFQLYLKHING